MPRQRPFENVGGAWFGRLLLPAHEFSASSSGLRRADGGDGLLNPSSRINTTRAFIIIFLLQNKTTLPAGEYDGDCYDGFRMQTFFSLPLEARFINNICDRWTTHLFNNFVAICNCGATPWDDSG